MRGAAFAETGADGDKNGEVKVKVTNRKDGEVNSSLQDQGMKRLDVTHGEERAWGDSAFGARAGAGGQWGRAGGREPHPFGFWFTKGCGF